MSITLNHDDFQCLQDQLVDLKTKNYELAEKHRRGQADFEAAKAKICSLQLKLEEQERDFQVTSTTLRRELEAVNSSQQEAVETSKEENEHYKNKYKILLHKAKEIQLRYDKSNEENATLKLDLAEKENELVGLKSAFNEYKEKASQIDPLKEERDQMEQQVVQLNAKLNQQVEEHKLQDKKGSQLLKELKRQLAIEKNKNDTLQRRLENLLSSSANGSNNGSWGLVPTSVGDSNLSICSIELSEEQDTTKNTSISAATTGDTKSDKSDVNSNISQHIDQRSNDTNASQNISSNNIQTNESSNNNNNHDRLDRPEMPLDEQAALLKRLTQLQHDNWTLEEKLSFLEQTNVALTEELANKSDIIKNYFINQALKTKTNQRQQKQPDDELPPFMVATAGTRRISFPQNINQLLGDNSGLKKVVDFVKERSQQISLSESDTVTREATKKMQVMLEETLVKCLKLQENLDFVTSELNKVK